MQTVLFPHTDVLVILAPPGAGKSTWAHAHPDDSIDADQTPGFQALWQRYESELKGRSMIDGFTVDRWIKHNHVAMGLLVDILTQPDDDRLVLTSEVGAIARMLDQQLLLPQELLFVIPSAETITLRQAHDAPTHPGRWTASVVENRKLVNAMWSIASLHGIKMVDDFAQLSLRRNENTN